MNRKIIAITTVLIIWTNTINAKAITVAIKWAIESTIKFA